MLNCGYDLPKVKLRFKTDPSELCPSHSQYLHDNDKFDPAPSVYLSRLKNGKEIHEAHMRFRSLKKNNYMRHFFTHKKNLSATLCQRMNTTVAKNPQRKLLLALQTTFYKQCEEAEAARKRKFRELLTHKKQDREEQDNKRQQLFVSSKNHTVQLKARRNLTFQPAISTSTPLKLSVPYQHDPAKYERDGNERMLRQIKKGKIQMKATRASKSFLIQAWKQDKIIPVPSFACKNQFQPEWF